MDTSLATRIATKITTGSVRSPKRATVNMHHISLTDALLNTKTWRVMNAVAMANVRDHTGITVPLIVTR